MNPDVEDRIKNIDSRLSSLENKVYIVSTLFVVVAGYFGFEYSKSDKIEQILSESRRDGTAIAETLLTATNNSKAIESMLHIAQADSSKIAKLINGGKIKIDNKCFVQTVVFFCHKKETELNAVVLEGVAQCKDVFDGEVLVLPKTALFEGSCVD